MFNDAIRKQKYDGEYYYCYCTKSSHFSFIVEETMKQNVHLETSFAYDIEIIRNLYQRKKFQKIHLSFAMVLKPGPIPET